MLAQGAGFKFVSPLLAADFVSEAHGNEPARSFHPLNEHGRRPRIRDLTTGDAFEPGRIVPFEEKPAACSQVASSALDVRPTNERVSMIDQARCKEDDVEGPVQLQFLDRTADSFHASRDVRQHFFREVDGSRLEPPLQQGAREPPSARAQFED